MARGGEATSGADAEHGMRWTIGLAVPAVLAMSGCGGDKAGHEEPIFEVDVATDAGAPDAAGGGEEWAVPDAGLDLAPDGDGGPPDESGDDGAGGDECPCVADTIRYCDSPAYCAWGAQICEVSPEGIHRWSGCEEESIPPGCDPWGALAQPYEWHYAGGYWDGQIDDAEGDGVVTSEPDWWLNPAGQDCAMRAGLCVQDAWDLDVDGDVEESIGNCQVEEC